MTYAVLKLVHIIGAILIGAGLVGVWVSDMRSRQCRELSQFSEAVRSIAVFYDGLVVLLLSLVTALLTTFGLAGAAWACSCPGCAWPRCSPPAPHALHAAGAARPGPLDDRRQQHGGCHESLDRGGRLSLVDPARLHHLCAFLLPRGPQRGPAPGRHAAGRLPGSRRRGHAHRRIHGRSGDPYEVFYERCFIAFEGDEEPVYRMWDHYEDVGLWSSDYPHHDAEDAWEALELMERHRVPPEVQHRLTRESRSGPGPFAEVTTLGRSLTKEFDEFR